MTFALMAAGLLIGFARHLRQSGWRLSLSLAALVSAALLCQMLSATGDFIGPVGDARGYVETINSCVFAVRLCGDRMHTYLLGAVATLTGPAWALVYGFAVFQVIKALQDRVGNLVGRPFLLLLLSYCAYQIANGMGEFTYTILILVMLGFVLGSDRLAFGRVKNTLLGGGAFLLAVAAHPGNVFAAGGVFRSWKLALLGAAISAVVLGAFWEEFAGLSAKAAAIESAEARTAAIETKLAVSERSADTSYAPWLYDRGFPYEPTSAFYAVLAFAAPVVTGPASAADWLVAGLSTLMSGYGLYLVMIGGRERKIMMASAVALAFFVFGMSSFTPGIGLRHKVPLFVMLVWVAAEPLAARSKVRITLGRRAAAA